MQNGVDEVVGVLPSPAVLRVDEEDEVAEAQVPEENPDSLHRFPEKKRREILAGKFLARKVMSRKVLRGRQSFSKSTLSSVAEAFKI